MTLTILGCVGHNRLKCLTGIALKHLIRAFSYIQRSNYTHYHPQ